MEWISMRLKVFSSLLLIGLTVQAQPELPVWTNFGPGGGGWIQSILGGLASADELFVGCDVGGFYHSVDGGKNYVTSNTGLECYYLDSLAQHPKNQDILFAGSLGGVYKSVDRGRSWSLKRSGWPEIERYSWSAPVSCIVFDPVNPDIVYVANGAPRERRGKLGRIFRSADCGENWEQIVGEGQLPEGCNIISLVVDRSVRNRLLISTSKGLFSSVDGGVTWEHSDRGLPAHLSCRRLVQSPSSPNIFYVTMFAESGQVPWAGGIYRSDDGGRTWVERNEGIPKRVAKAGQTSSLTCNVDRIQVHPTNPDIVYVGGSAWVNATVYKTTDGGLNWTATIRETNESLSEARGWITFWGLSVYCLSMSPVDPDRLYFGTSGQVVSTSDGGKTWKPIYYRQHEDGTVSGCGLEVTCLHCVVPHPTIKDKLFLGYFDIGLLVSDNGGKSMRQSMEGIPGKYRGSCFSLAFHPDNSLMVWGIFGNWGGDRSRVLARSLDCGASWQVLDAEDNGLSREPMGNLLCLKDEKGVFVMVTQATKGVMVSRDLGDSFQPLNAGLPGTGIRCVASSGDGLWCVTERKGEQHAAMYRYSGEQWIVCGDGTVPFADLKQLVCGSGGVIYACAREGKVGENYCQGGLYSSTDGGKSWNHLYANHFCEGMTINPQKPNQIVAGFTDHPFHDKCVGAGVMLSNDGGKTWTSLNSRSLHNKNASRLAFDPFVPGKLFAGSGGNSVFWTILE